MARIHPFETDDAGLVLIHEKVVAGKRLSSQDALTLYRTADLLALYAEFYAGEPFVRVLPEGERPTTRHIVGSNFCDVTVVADPRTRRAVCVSALDNLGKGGSANGIQNLNVMMGWDERSGLEAPPVYP